MSDFSFASILQTLSAGFGITILMTVVSFTVGTMLAIPLALMRTSKLSVLRAPAVAVIDISRGIPPLVWLLIIYFGISPIVPLEPLPAGLIGLSIISAGYLAENFRAGIDNVHLGQKEAAAALGLTPSNQFWRITAPQALNISIPPSASYAVALLKDTAIASIIGVADIIFLAQNEVSRGGSAVLVFSVAAMLYLLVGIPLSYFSRFVDGVVRSKVVTV
ncbi:amino acid ABC transporter permease [Brevibacterium sp. UCMA 11754]|uniref:amino acid ABC transporter permease n=1 Tax=Brevibacterium sp. UCMA 11754 TaxID=2749198 RepID=UPI001F1F24EB|nr:amino acid ABC transporter permease [Brevibacterium sp. UCMA 11754]MCF2570875.1 amino acid ABC transporter permease [Brevibacterium sp. UCMA 11754]